MKKYSLFKIGVGIFCLVAWRGIATPWFKTLGEGCGYGVQQTQDGGYIVTGGTDSDCVCLIKTDSLGDTMWTETFGGDSSDVGRDIQQTSDGGYIITGYTYSYGAGRSDIWLIKTDLHGDTMWTKTFGGSSNDCGYSVEQTKDGGYIVVGYTFSFSIDTANIWLIRTDSLGDTLWTKCYGKILDQFRVNSYGYSVQQTDDGGYIIAGTTHSGSGVCGDGWLVKTDSIGDTLWTKVFTGAGKLRSVRQTKEGGYILAGGWGLSTVSGLVLIKTDSFGDTVWTKGCAEYGYCTSAQSVCLTIDGGYVITGNCDWEYHRWGSRLLLAKVDSFGEALWTRRYGGLDWSTGYCVKQTKDNGYIITGKKGTSTIWLIKADSTGIGIEEKAVSPSCNQKYIVVCPNPFLTCAKIRCRTKNPEITIYDISGKLIRKMRDNIIGKNLQAGIYFLKAKGCKPVKVIKLR